MKTTELLALAKEKMSNLEMHSPEYAELECSIRNVEKDASKDNVEYLHRVMGELNA